MRAGGAHGLGQYSLPQGAEPCLSPGFLKGTSPQFGGPPARRRPEQFPTSGSQTLLDMGLPREEGFCVGNKPRLGTAPHRVVRELPPSGVSQGWRTKPVGSGAGQGEAGALGSPCPQALSAKRRGPAWGWVAASPQP